MIDLLWCQLDASNIGFLGNIITNLGAAAAAVVVTIYFIGFLREQSRIIATERAAYLVVQEKFQLQLEKIVRHFGQRQDESQNAFQSQLQKLTEGQNEILTETIQVVKKLEVAVDGVKQRIDSVVAIKQIEKKEC